MLVGQYHHCYRQYWMQSPGRVERRKALIDGYHGPMVTGELVIAVCSFLPLYLAPAAVAESRSHYVWVLSAISLGLSWLPALTQTTSFGNLWRWQPRKMVRIPTTVPYARSLKEFLLSWSKQGWSLFAWWWCLRARWFAVCCPNFSLRWTSPTLGRILFPIWRHQGVERDMQRLKPTCWRTEGEACIYHHGELAVAVTIWPAQAWDQNRILPMCWLNARFWWYAENRGGFREVYDENYPNIIIRSTL